MKRSFPFLALSCLAISACSEVTPAAPQVQGVELGVFYGGQVQQRRSIPWPSTERQPTWGFRLTFREPLER